MKANIFWMASLFACSCGEQPEFILSEVPYEQTSAFDMKSVVGEAPAAPATRGVSGTLSRDDRTMTVRGGFATWNSRMGGLQVMLFPFELTDEEAEAMSHRDFFFLSDRPNPNPQVFAKCPYGTLRFMFSDEKNPSFSENLSSLNVEYQGFDGKMGSSMSCPALTEALREQLAACSMELGGEAVIAIKGSLHTGTQGNSWSVAARLPVFEK